MSTFESAVPTLSDILSGNATYAQKQYTTSTTPASTATQQVKSSTGTIQDDSAYDTSSSSSSSSSSDSQDVAEARFQLEQSLNQYNDALNRTNNQQSTALSNIENDYNSSYNRLLGSQATSNQTYETNTNNQINDYVTAREGIASDTRGLITSGKRLLGAAGAGGGSADRYAVPNAAQLEGSNQNAKVQETNAENLAALTSGHQEDERNFQNSFADLSGQKDKSNRSTISQYEQQRADILSAIATLTGQKAILNGQNYQQALAAAQPYTSRIGSILDTIDSLAANPTTIRENSVTLAQPNLADYTYDRFTAPTANSAAAQDTSLSALAALTGTTEDKKKTAV